jgi:hypothetical protein
VGVVAERKEVQARQHEPGTWGPADLSETASVGDCLLVRKNYMNMGAAYLDAGAMNLEGMKDKTFHEDGLMCEESDIVYEDTIARRCRLPRREM